MSLTTDDIVKIAKLARIGLSEQDKQFYTNEMNKIFGWIEQLQKINTDGVEPMTSIVSGNRLPMRDDVVNDGHCREKILANAPKAEYGCFAVPKVIE